jgi:molybdopterin molybdotransferase
VNFLLFVRPYLRIAVGDPRPYLPVVDAIAGDDFHDGPGRARLIRVVLERDGNGYVAFPTGSQSSGVLTSMVRAHGLLLVGVDATAPVYGDAVRVQIIEPSFLAGSAPDYGW